ncbi:hypothetical protein O181_004231 [Austropuccinia psidii MF-1]|uniref:Uncharacterized protein n=1 Tax=Austropuccinia psidii MF-1 TaxID=1389203 RepID=A0A9Q3GEU5_9BASI|nr:hypothetical protein [Austropuccinia psidii MF-1]
MDPKPQEGPHEPNFGPNLKRPKMTQGTQKPQNGHPWPYTARLHQWPLETTRGHQLITSRVSPQVKGNPFPQLWTPHCRNQEWGIYGIIYHYAPFFLRNPIVTLSRLHSFISSHITISPVHLKKNTQIYSSWKFMVESTRPFEDTNHLALQLLDLVF